MHSPSYRTWRAVKRHIPGRSCPVHWQRATSAARGCAKSRPLAPICWKFRRLQRAIWGWTAAIPGRTVRSFTQLPPLPSSSIARAEEGRQKLSENRIAPQVRDERPMPAIKLSDICEISFVQGLLRVSEKVFSISEHDTAPASRIPMERSPYRLARPSFAIIPRVASFPFSAASDMRVSASEKLTPSATALSYSRRQELRRPSWSYHRPSRR